MQQRLLRSCHDLSEGGLAVALAESAFAGGVGAEVHLNKQATESDEVLLFSESPSRFLVEVRPADADAFERAMSGVPVSRIGQTNKGRLLSITGRSGERLISIPLTELKEAWQRPLRW
jgi:phosphoribosylformylglycinamidine synthase